ncbi:MAG: NAD(P)-dependent oxidoreductase [Verrucomicrobiota bacterium]
MRVLVTGGSGFIGRHLIAHLLEKGYEVVNVDITPPAEASQRALWREGSILDASGLERCFRDVRPSRVVHLAALAIMEGKSIDEFSANTDGTANVLAAVRAVGTVERLVVTSTQHVRKPGSPPPKSDEDYVPYMLYGESKVITEKLTRAAGLSGHWTLIRPTAVWGPHHPFLVNGLWRLIHRGLYVHPSHDPVVRSYGYVRNIAWQIERILSLPAASTHGKTLYVGDENARQQDWINGFAQALTGRDVRTVPLWSLRVLAGFGDGVRAVGLRFPLYGSRLYNLITSNPVPIQPTFDILGRGPVAMADGIEETASWLRSQYGVKQG